jgi:hypothetical protein
MWLVKKLLSFRRRYRAVSADSFGCAFVVQLMGCPVGGDNDVSADEPRGRKSSHSQRLAVKDKLDEPDAEHVGGAAYS